MPAEAKSEDVRAYIAAHLKEIARPLAEVAEDLSGLDRDAFREFEDRVDRQLRNGAKFIPRKRQPR
jgi:hypothetical protein